MRTVKRASLLFGYGEGPPSPARKVALTEASVCVIVGLQEEEEGRMRGSEEGLQREEMKR